MNKMHNQVYTELTVKPKNKKASNAQKFYWIKQILAKCDCETYHFLEKDDGIKLWLLGLRNQEELTEWLELAEINYKRQKSLVEQGVAPKEKFDQAKKELEVLKAEKRALKQQVIFHMSQTELTLQCIAWICFP